MTVDSVGGVWQYAIDLAAALQPDTRVTLAHLGPPLDTAQHALATANDVRVIATGLPLDWLANDPRAVRDAAAAIARLAEAEGADIVHLNGPALAGAARFGRPVFAVDHGSAATWWDAVRPGEALPASLAWHAALVGDGLRTAARVVVPTAAHGEAVRRCYRLPFAPVTVHNGRPAIACEQVAPARRAFTAGRLWDAAKSTPLLDKVAALLPFPFEAAGSTVAPHGEAVTLRYLSHCGTLDEAALRAQLAARPLFVSAARFEPFGLAVLEAAGAGCPLVLADTATFRELWDGAALFVAGDDPASWADAIVQLADDTAAATRLGDAAAARAVRYTPAASAEAMRKLYADALSPMPAVQGEAA